MKIGSQSDAVSGGPQSVDLVAGEPEPIVTEIQTELSVAENTGLNNLMAGNTSSIVQDTKKPTTTLFPNAAGLLAPNADATNSVPANANATIDSRSKIPPQNPFSRLTRMVGGLLQGVIQNTTQRASSPTTAPDKPAGGNNAANANSTAPATATAAAEREHIRPESGPKQVVPTTKIVVPVVSAAMGVAGADLIASLAGGTPTPSPSAPLQSKPAKIKTADDGLNMAQLRELGLLPAESGSATSGSQVSSRLGTTNSSLQRAKVIIPASLAADGTLSSQGADIAAQPGVGRSGTTNRSGAISSTGLALENENRVFESTSRESVERQRTWAATHQDHTIGANETSAPSSIPTSTSNPAQFSAGDNPEAVSQWRGGNQSDSSQGEQSSNKKPSDSSSAVTGEAALPILTSYQPPLFNRRLEKNGVDDGLILLVGSLREKDAGRVVQPVRPEPVTPVPIVAEREESPEERATQATFLEQENVRPSNVWAGSAIWPHFQFHSQAPLYTLDDTISQPPAAQRRRTQTLIMSDPRSTAVAERAAFWVRADMDGTRRDGASCSFTISATTSHRALHPVWMQSHAKYSKNSPAIFPH